jgi:hypothetical protein
VKNSRRCVKESFENISHYQFYWFKVYETNQKGMCRLKPFSNLSTSKDKPVIMGKFRGLLKIMEN